MRSKILILTADDDTRDILRIALQQREYTISEVADGREIIAKAKKEKPDLIIADIMMPYIDGYEGIEKLKENSRFINTPVLFISCIVSGEAFISVLKKMEGCTFLEKLFNHKTLLKTIDTLLKNSSMSSVLQYITNRKDNHAKYFGY